MKYKKIAALVAAASMLGLSACSSDNATDDASGSTGKGDGNITLWLAGSDTPQELRDYLVTTFEKDNPGSTLTIEEQAWGDLVTKLTTALPDEKNTPDVVEIGNTQAPTFTTVGAFRDLSPIYEELGGKDLLQSFGVIGLNVVF